MRYIDALYEHVKRLRRLHCADARAIRAMIGTGILPGVGQAPAAHHKSPEEPLPEYLARHFSEGGPLTSPADFATARARLVASKALSLVKIPTERILDAVAFIKASSRPVSAKAIFLLLGGDVGHTYRVLDELRLRGSTDAERAVMQAADIDGHHLAALVRQGLLEELRRDGPEFGKPIDLTTILQDIVRRHSEWAPERFDFQTVKDVAVIRAGLRLGCAAHHSEGVLGGATDLFLSRGLVPTPLEVELLIGGDIDQIDDYLRTRARVRGDVPLPRRTIRGVWKLTHLPPVLPPELSELYDTALDPERGTTRDKVSRPDIGRIAQNGHAQLQAISAVVTLHGARRKAFAGKAAKANRATSNLEGPLTGTDVTNAAQLAAAFAAQRLMLKGVKDRHDVHRANEDMDNWRHVIEIFDSYASRPDLPPALSAYLRTIRPAFPSGGDTLFMELRRDLDHFKEVSKSLRDKNLQPFLADVPAFLRMTLGAQAQLEALREHVRDSVAKAEKRSGGAISSPVSKAFKTTATLPDGSIAAVVYRYKIHTWKMVTDAVRKRKAGFRKASVEVFDNHPGGSELFENRYAVQMIDCTLDGTVIDYPLPIMHLHYNYAFWQARSCPSAQAFDLRFKALSDAGLSHVTLTLLGPGIGNFDRSKTGWIRGARKEFDMFLFPLEEAHHSALIGALHVASRAIHALRVGDLTQWDVGAGLETGHDAAGQPFSVLSSIPKMKVKQRKSALSSESETLAEKLLALASERFFAGGPIPLLARFRYNGKGAEFASLIFCLRDRGMPTAFINNHSRLLMGGLGSFKSHYLKYIWSKLSRTSGDTLEQRREAHGHTTQAMTEEYDVLTPDEEVTALVVMREAAQLRQQWHRGERESPVPDAPIETLEFNRDRLLNDMAFLATKKAGVEIDTVKAQLRLLEAKIARAAVGP